MKFIHLRYVNEEDNIEKIQNLGGVSLLIDEVPIKDSDEYTVFFAITVCSENDNFSKKIAREKLKHRYHNNANFWCQHVNINKDIYKKMKTEDFIEEAYYLWPDYLSPWITDVVPKKSNNKV